MFELSHLRSFVAVAEELHFGRAASRLNITQPPLSRQIQALERLLAVELFVRANRSVRLTSAGHALLREAHRLLDHAEAALLATRRSSETQTGTIGIGLIGAATYDVLPRLVQEARRTMPEIELSFTEMLTPEQVDAIGRRRIDIGIGRLPNGARGIQTAVIARERLLLALPDKHPLTCLPTLTLQNLGSYPFIAYEPGSATTLFELLEHIFIAAQFTPNIIQRSKQTQTILSLVSAGAGVALVPETAQQACFANVVFRAIHIENDPLLDMHALWRPDSFNPVLPAFRGLLLATCSAERTYGAPEPDGSVQPREDVPD